MWSSFIWTDVKLSPTLALTFNRCSPCDNLVIQWTDIRPYLTVTKSLLTVELNLKKYIVKTLLKFKIIKSSASVAPMINSSSHEPASPHILQLLNLDLPLNWISKNVLLNTIKLIKSSARIISWCCLFIYLFIFLCTKSIKRSFHLPHSINRHIVSKWSPQTKLQYKQYSNG